MLFINLKLINPVYLKYYNLVANIRQNYMEEIDNGI